MRQRHRVFAVLSTVSVLVAMNPMMGQPPATAATQSAGSPKIDTRTVTLITGDTVTVGTADDGRQAVSVDRGTGREAINFASVEDKGGMYVIPDDAQRLLKAGKLDRELFNVTRLVRDGYDDKTVASLPLIISYGTGAGAASRVAQPAPQASSKRLTLKSIGGMAVAADKGKAESFWTDITGARTDRSAAAADQFDDGIAKVWLDGKATASLDVSVPQIGAPQMWQAGYDGTGVKVAVLDTGVDATHPDLADEIVGSQSFVPGEAVADGHGHGTHVASTIAGSGDGSGGKYKGVAPGADLLVGKVLANSGSGDYSWIIAGMEWAVASGADIVSMSLGGTAYEASDPLSQAVDRLSTSSGALFVIAASNAGPAEQTIGSPGIADSALTVGAVSKTEVLASFSSRGPRVGDYGVKPEITAPGVSIVAARAAGTTMGTPVDGRYTSAGGTSMATPHVAGAAAIVAQAHPDWTGQQIKAALSSTARTNAAYTPFQQGNGRVDVPRAVTQNVFATPALSYGLFQHDASAPVSKEITYTNTTSAPVTLNLTSTVTGGSLSLSASEVTVPANGTTTVTTTVDSGKLAIGRYTGYVTANDPSGAIAVTTAVGFEKETERYDITVNFLDRNGEPAEWALYTMLELGGAVTGYGWTGGTQTFRVPPGTYSIGSWISTLDGAGNEISTSVVGDPQIEVSGDVTLTFDARKAVEIKPVTMHPDAEHQGITTSWSRGRPGVSSYGMTRVQGAWGGLEHVYAAPTEQVTDGVFNFYSKFHLYAKELTGKVTGPERFTLAPKYANNYSGFPVKITGDRRVRLVGAGNGSAEAFKGLDVRGKAVLVALEPTDWAHEAVENAIAAGAGYLLAYRKTPGQWWTAVNSTTIPVMTVSGEEGAKLQSLLAKGKVQLELGGTAVSPYMYELMLPESGRIPEQLTYRIDRSNTAKVIARYPGTGKGEDIGLDTRFTFRPGDLAALGVGHYLQLGTVRTEYYSANDTTYTRWVAQHWSHGGEQHGPYHTYQPGATSTESWLGQVVRPATVARYGATSRTGDKLTVQIPEFSAAGDGYYGYAGQGDTVATKLYANGALLGELKTWAWGTLTVPAGNVAYRLTVDATRQADWAPYSTRSSTEWSFTSATTSEKQVLPLLSIDYDIDLDLYNRADDKCRFTFGLKIRHQEGSTPAPITGVKAWASYDDGVSWQAIEIGPNRAGGYRATVQHPAVRATNGYVSLRVQATDANGNQLDQTVKRAYGLK